MGLGWLRIVFYIVRDRISVVVRRASRCLNRDVGTLRYLVKTTSDGGTPIRKRICYIRTQSATDALWLNERTQTCRESGVLVA